MTEPDAQRRAFTDARTEDWRAIPPLGTIHEPDDPAAAPIRTPEEWDAAGWDADRDGPKEVDEARAALAARIANPHAPDTAAVAGAYDGLEDDE